MASIQDGEVIPRETLDAIGRYTRFHILAELNLQLALSGVTLRQLAELLGNGWSERKVKSLLSGNIPINVEPLGEVLFSINGSVVKLAPDRRAQSEQG